MAISYKITAVGREPNQGRRFFTIEITLPAGLGTITKEITHINPKDPTFRADLRAYIRSYVNGLRAQRQAQQQNSVPPLTQAEQDALIAEAPDDAENL